MSKRSDNIRAHAIRRAHRQKRQSTARSRALRAKRRNAIPPGVAWVPRRGFRKVSLDEIGTIQIPRRFSLLEDPDTVLEIYSHTDYLLRMKHKTKINVYHNGCADMDLGASILLDTLFMQAERRRTSNGREKHIVQGFVSRINQDVNIMLVASGLPKHLGIEIPLPEYLKERISTFERQSGTASHLEKEKNRNQCASELTDYFNGCLKKKGCTLTPIGRANLGILITEVIGNAQEHGGPWHAIGFYDDLKLGGVGGECHIVIFNYGPTIYQTLSAPDVSEKLQEELRSLSDHHESHGWLSRSIFPGRAALTEECLWTLYALQDRVTRFFGQPGKEDRGAGTVKMIEFFEELAGDSPMRMCVLSGGAYILFNGRHRIRPQRFGEDELKVIAFNDDNDLWKPPDPRYVRQLDRSFPGTVISIRLTLDPKVLQRLAQGVRNDS